MLLDILYPYRCPLCGEVQPYKQKGACKDCFRKLKVIQSPYCLKCGKEIENEELEYCIDCVSVPKNFEKGFPVFYYKEPLKTALYDLKYHNQRYYADFFGQCIAAKWGKTFSQLDISGIVPVPLHPHKMRKRGYNQTVLLAKELSRCLQIPYYKDFLIRTIDTNPQKELNDKDRMKNLKNAFQLGTNAIKLNKVLLVDDIYTSGATIEACTKVLLHAGVEKVFYTSVAIGKGYSC